MMVTLLPGTNSANAIETLRTVANKLALVGSGDVQTVHTHYLRWVNDAADALGTRMSAGDVERLVLTPRQWTLQSLVPGPHSALMSLVQLEVREAQRRLTMAIDQLEVVHEQWKYTPGLLVVPDTNVYLHHRHRIDQVHWAQVVDARPHVQVNLVLPMVVLDELDRHKRTNNRNRARTALRIINGWFAHPGISATVVPAAGAGGSVVAHLWLDDPRHVRLPHPDSELVDRAQSLAALTGRNVTIVTFDTGMALRARAAGLESRHLTEQDEETH
jgi:hypothetical protein